jgi:cobalt-zinc-cadmium efflux system protein
MYALSCHALINDVSTSKSAAMLQSLNTMLADKYRIGHTTIQFECNDHEGSCCEMRGLYCSMEAAVDKCNGQTSPHSHTHTAEDDACNAEPNQMQTPMPVAKRKLHKKEA